MDTRNKLILYLKQSESDWVSGEHLSRRLSISRAAINKHVSGLRKIGYQIKSSTRKGYLLEKSPDILLAGEIRDGLSTTVFGKQEIIYLQEVDSTNTRAKELAAKGSPEGTIVIAEKQIIGRGRMGRSWFSPENKGIYISMILRPAMPPSKTSVITLLTAVAVAEALLLLTDMDVKIKWPNDILIKGKKIAGILTEISMEMDSIDFIIIGLGLNVNTSLDEMPEAIQQTATSFFIETGLPVSRAAIIRAYLEKFEHYYGILGKHGFKPVMDRWKALSGIIGKQVDIDVMGNRYKGMVEDIDNDGVLILCDKNGDYHRIFSGDVIVR